MYRLQAFYNFSNVENDEKYEIRDVFYLNDSETSLNGTILKRGTRGSSFHCYLRDAATKAITKYVFTECVQTTRLRVQTFQTFPGFSVGFPTVVCVWLSLSNASAQNEVPIRFENSIFNGLNIRPNPGLWCAIKNPKRKFINTTYENFVKYFELKN